MFYRNVITELRKWASAADRKPLILRGARQVGKTTAVDMFAKDFDLYISLNLEKKEEASLFNKNLSVEELIQAIFFIKNVSYSNNGCRATGNAG